MPITHSTEIINGEAITILIETADSQDSTAQTTERTRATTRGVASDTLRHAQNVFSRVGYAVRTVKSLIMERCAQRTLHYKAE